MLDFNIDLNPNHVDLNTYNCDQAAASNTALTAHIPMRPQNGFPEGFDIPVGDIVNVPISGTGYPFSSCKIYYPEGEGPFPVLFYIHGGAFFGGWQFLDEPLCRQVCHDCGIAVISPTYVLAPDFKFPLPLIEMYKDLLYLRDHQSELKLDMTRMAVGGGSAGAHHALGMCQLVHERYDQDHLQFKYGVFYYPVLDCFTPGKERADALSDTYGMPPEMIDIFINSYYPEGQDRKDPLFSPILMNLDALPPSVMFSGRTDTLNQEFRRFTHRILEEGKNEVIFKIYPDVRHGFLEGDVGVAAARDSKAIVCDILKRTLTQQ